MTDMEMAERGLGQWFEPKDVAMETNVHNRIYKNASGELRRFDPFTGATDVESWFFPDEKNDEVRHFNEKGERITSMPLAHGIIFYGALCLYGLLTVVAFWYLTPIATEMMLNLVMKLMDYLAVLRSIFKPIP